MPSKNHENHKLRHAWIPLFALPCVVFPGESIPFHIFEPRYQAMIRDCLSGEVVYSPSGTLVEEPLALPLKPYSDALLPIHFGVTSVIEDTPSKVGCAVIIEKVIKAHSDGTFDILTKGIARYIIRQIDRTMEYPTALIEFFYDDLSEVSLSIDELPMNENEVGRKRQQASALHMRLRELASGTPVVPLGSEGNVTAFSLAHDAGLSLPQRQTLLEILVEPDRLDFLINHYRQVIPLLEEAALLRQRISLNGHLRHIKSITI